LKNIIAESDSIKRPHNDISEFELSYLEVFLQESLDRKTLQSNKTASELEYIKEDLKCIEYIKIRNGCINSHEDQALSNNIIQKFANHIPALIESYLATHEKPQKPQKAFDSDTDLHPSLKHFNQTLLACAKYTEFKTLANIFYADAFFDNSSSIISSIEFDMNDEFFCTAGVSKKIRIFDYALVTEPIPSLSNSITKHSGPSDELPDSDMNHPAYQKYPIREIQTSSYQL
jgi:hypothetical protein